MYFAADRAKIHGKRLKREREREKEIGRGESEFLEGDGQ